MGLYKYVVPERIDILQHEFIRFTQPSALNDPFEMKPFFLVFEPSPEMLDELKNSPQRIITKAARRRYNALSAKDKKKTTYQKVKRKVEEDYPERLRILLSKEPEDVEEVRKHVWERLDARLGVLSLTREPYNLLMWTHYAQNHEGFVIEFDETHPYFNKVASPTSEDDPLWGRRPSEESGYLREVKYPTKRPVFRTSLEMSPANVLLVKSKEWKYENELRMFQPLEKCKKTIIVKKQKVHLFKLPISCIKGVIFGCNMSEKNRSKVSSLLESNRKFSHIEQHSAILEKNKFVLKMIE